MAGDGNRIRELENLIVRYQKSYYNGEGEVSDAEFDRLWDELRERDPSNPLLHRVGADSGNFAKVAHVMPMGSQDKAASPEEFRAWAAKHAYDEYLVEFKLDGASLELQYEGGRLARAVTRGDGSVGDDITANAVRMQGVRQELRLQDGSLVSFTGGIRGEVIMTHAVHKKYFSDKANCRNAANGLMKRKDGSGSEHLSLITYDVWATAGEQPYADEEGKLEWLKSLGFTTAPLKICRSPDDVIDYRASVMESRAKLDYDIDGLVVKERAVNHEDAMRDRPDRQVAFKFSLEEAVTVVRQVEWGESGATYTPVAVFDPVELNGTTVQRASVVNPNTIRSLGLKIGSHVVVVKRGEIIPKIEGVVHPASAAAEAGVSAGTGGKDLAGGSDGQLALFQGLPEEREIEFPTTCSSCGSPLVDEGTRLFCPNKACPKRVLHQVMKWVAVLDIRDLGEKLVRALFKDGLVRSISDIYS
ncbi:MAG: DNA ligase (NAD(+)) LigA, partial [Treponema sp.]|nr:DNA ligase (NAD(+)) LigA [Treponema sp.]